MGHIKRQTHRVFTENEAYQNHQAQAFHFVGADMGMGWEGAPPHTLARAPSRRATGDGDRSSLNLPCLPQPTGPSAFPQSPLDPVTCLPPPPQGGVGLGM